MINILKIYDKNISLFYIALVFLFALPLPYIIYLTIDWQMVQDAAVPHYVSWNILEGKAPYKDLFIINLPGTYLIHMAFIKWFEPLGINWRMFDLIWTGQICIIIFCFLKNVSKISALLACILFIYFHINNGAILMGQRDFLMIPFIIFSLHYFAKFIEDNKNKYLAFSGVSLGISILVKPFPLILLLFFAIECSVKFRSFHKSAIPILLLGCASFIPLLVVLVWLYIVGGVSELFSLIFELLIPIYSNADSLKYYFFDRVVPQYFLLSTASLLVIFLHWNIRIRLILYGLLYGYLHFYLQQKGFWQHVYILVVFLICFSSLAVKYVPVIFPRKLRITQSILTVVGIIFLANGFLIKPVKGTSIDEYYQSLSDDQMIDKANQILTDIEDAPCFGRLQSNNKTIQAIDDVQGAYLAMKWLSVKSATKFIYTFPLFNNIEEPYIRSLQREFMTQLKDSQPEVFIVSHNLYHIGNTWSWKERRFPEFVGYLKKNYYRTADRDTHEVYCIRHNL